MSSATLIPPQKMRQILEVSRLLAVTADLDKLLVEIARAAAALLGAERASIFLHDGGTNELWTKVALGASQIRVPDSAGIVGSVFHSRQITNIPDAYADPRFNREVDRKTGYVTRNLLTAPMLDLKGRTIGVIQAVNKIGGIFAGEDEQTIELLAGQGGVAIQRYYLQVDAIQVVELRREMDLAKGVQESVLPHAAPQIPGIEAVGWTRPASITGGDGYDLWQVGDNRLGIFLGDAAGHGLAPALEVLQARTLTRAMSDINCDPAWILRNVNARLAKDLKLGHFVTVFMGCLGSQGDLVWSSAGHGPVLYRESPDDPVRVLEPAAPPVGVDEELALDLSTPVQLGHGGLLAVMSDGIFESMNPQQELFGVERVIEILDAHRHESPAALLAYVREAVKVWQGREEPVDDQTIVFARRQ